MTTVCCRCSHGASLFSRQWTSSLISTPIPAAITQQLPRRCTPSLLPRTRYTVRHYASALPAKSNRSRQTSKPTPSTPSPKHRASPTASTVTSQQAMSFYDKLAHRTTPTLLYTSVKSGWGVVGRMLFFVLGAAYTGHELWQIVLDPGNGLQMIPRVLSAIPLALIGGVALAAFPRRLDGSITKIVAKPSATTKGALRLVVDTVYLPGSRGTFECNPEDFRIGSRTLLQQTLPASIPERKALYEKEIREKTGRWERIKRRFDNNILRQKNVGVRIGLEGARTKWCDMDLYSGSMLDQGKALDRVLLDAVKRKETAAREGRQGTA